MSAPSSADFVSLAASITTLRGQVSSLLTQIAELLPKWVLMGSIPPNIQ